MSTLSADTKRRMQQYESTYNKLQKHLDAYSNFQPWLIFKVQNTQDGKDVDTIVIDTFTSTAKVNIVGDHSYSISPIMLTNFEYNKNGSGKANSFTITFAFNPDEKTGDGRLIDPSIIDKALVVNSYFTTDDSNNYRAVDTTAKHKCYMRFGYNFEEGDSLKSPEYFGQALHASSELRDGMIYYTLTGYSSITYIQDLNKLGIPERGTKTKNQSGIETGEFTGGWKTSDAMWDAINMFFGKEKRAEKNPNFEKIYGNIDVEIINEVDRDQDVEVYIAASSDEENFKDYLDRVASGANLKYNENIKDQTKRVTIEWKIIEEDSKLKFVIYTVDPADNQKLQEDRIVNVVYEYPTKKNNVVMSFTPEFKFEIIWGKDIFLGGEDEEFYKTHYIDENGVVKAYTNLNTSEIKDNPQEETASINTFAKTMQYNYKANLTTIGIPVDIPIGTIMYICPVINGYKYHYAGYYMILKTTDRLDTNGYTTEYDLMKLSAERTYEEKTAQAVENTLSSAGAGVVQTVDNTKNNSNPIKVSGGTYGPQLPPATPHNRSPYNRPVNNSPFSGTDINLA